MMMLVPWTFGVALAAIALAIVTAIGAAVVRSLFAALAFLMAASASAAIALLALDAPAAALAVALIGGCFAVVVLLGAVLLTARAAKERPLGARWIGVVFALAGVGAVAWAAPATPMTLTMSAPPDGALLLMAALALAGGGSAFGLIGLDDRAASAPRQPDAGR